MPNKSKSSIEMSELVVSLATYLANDETMAVILGLSLGELRDRYHEQIEMGRAKGNAKIGQTLYELAMNGNTAALIFLSKARLGLSDRPAKKATAGASRVIPMRKAE